MRDDLYKAVKEYKQQADKDGSYQKLDNESKRYINHTLAGMEETGTKLTKEGKKKFL